MRVQVRGTLEESSIDCLDEGCNGQVAFALVCKFNTVGFVGMCIGEAGSFNDGVARCAVGAYPNFYQGGLCNLVEGEW